MLDRNAQILQGARRDGGPEDTSSNKPHTEHGNSGSGPSQNQSCVHSMHSNKTQWSSPSPGHAKGPFQVDHDISGESASLAALQGRPEAHGTTVEGLQRNHANDYPSGSLPWTNGSYQGEKLPSVGEILQTTSPFASPHSSSTSRSPSWLDSGSLGRTSPRDFISTSSDQSRFSAFPSGPIIRGTTRPGYLPEVKTESTWDQITRPSFVTSPAGSIQHDQNIHQGAEISQFGRLAQSPFSHGYAEATRPRSSSRQFPSRSGTHNSINPTDPHAPSDESVGDTASDTALPKFVRKETVAGEGLFYYYDDGSRCPAYIDGERVNERWGVTKAGKPRRRLALACVTCRDKKIKCEPGEPKCAQCSKCGRECYTRPPARKHNSSSSVSSDHQGRPLSGYSAEPRESYAADRGRFSPTSPVSNKEVYGSNFVPKRVPEQSSEQRGRPQNVFPASNANDKARKRRKSSISGASPRSETLSPQFQHSSFTTHQHPVFASGRPNLARSYSRHAAADGIDPELDQLCKEDPFVTYPELATELLDLYFKHINPSAFTMFWRDQFMQWMEHERHKSAQDIMVAYSMMTVALRFYRGDVKTNRIREISQYAVSRQTCDLTLQLVQSCYLLAFFEFGIGQAEAASELFRSVLNTVSAINLNLEEPPVMENQNQNRPFGLSMNMFAECRRRTYWAVYTMDLSLSTGIFKDGFFSEKASSKQLYELSAGPTSILPIADVIRLHLPMDLRRYEESAINSCATFQDLALVTARKSPEELKDLDATAHFVLISTIWKNVIVNLYWSMHRPGDSYSDYYEELIRNLTRTLKVWADNLPSTLRYTPGNRRNLDYNLARGQGAAYIAMHSLFYTTRMKLNRHGRLQHMRHTLVAAIIRDAVHCAEEYLEFIQLVVGREKGNNPLVQDFLPPPLTIFAIITACDILSAKGRVSSIPQIIKLMTSGLCALEELCPVWAVANTQKALVQQRITDLSRQTAYSAFDPDASMHRDGVFSLSTPMERNFPLDGDAIYTATVEAHIGALEGVQSVNVSTHQRGHLSFQ